ncbi:MAG: hypothetical protein ABIK65_15690 [Candidatus Eisenbacteria bacterium]
MMSSRVIGALALVFAGFSGTSAENLVRFEFDTDGVVGDAPDSITASVGDSIFVDVWITENECITAMGIAATLCDSAGVVGFLGFDLAIPPPWRILEILDLGMGCTSITAFDLSLTSPHVAPLLYGTAIYLAAGETALSRLVLDPTRSGIWNSGFCEDGGLDIRATPLFLRIQGAAATSTSAWSSVKKLFR